MSQKDGKRKAGLENALIYNNYKSFISFFAKQI